MEKFVQRSYVAKHGKTEIHEEQRGSWKQIQLTKSFIFGPNVRSNESRRIIQGFEHSDGPKGKGDSVLEPDSVKTLWDVDLF